MTVLCNDSNESANSNQKLEKQREGPRTKVIVRRLPPSVTEEELLQQIGPLPPHDYFCFVPADLSLSPWAFCRAYINFVNLSDISYFVEKFDGYVFLDNTGNEFPAIVEFAPSQKIPKKIRKDPKCGSIEDDPEFKKFLESLKNPDSVQPLSMDVILEEIERKEKLRKEERDQLQQTPLTEFIAWRKQDRLRKREERRKLEIEKRKRLEKERMEREKDREKQKAKVATESKKEPVRRFAKENRETSKSCASSVKSDSLDKLNAAGKCSAKSDANKLKKDDFARQNSNNKNTTVNKGKAPAHDKLTTDKKNTNNTSKITFADIRRTNPPPQKYDGDTVKNTKDIKEDADTSSVKETKLNLNSSSKNKEDRQLPPERKRNKDNPSEIQYYRPPRARKTDK